MTQRALIVVGIGQCVNWGVLYYAFAVLLLPLERELGAPTWVVAGAFSLALLMSAALAPRVGAWCDRGRGPAVMQAGGFGGALVLALWALAPGGVGVLYAAWVGLGLCMAATLYEPAFVIVGRAFRNPKQRLRSLAIVTLFGGLASTVFLPITAWLLPRIGWRGAVLVLAAGLGLMTAVTHVFAFRAAAADGGAETRAQGVADTNGETDPPRFSFVASVFALTALAAAGFTANLISALDARGMSPADAAFLGALIGVMQLPGRVLLMNGGFGATASTLLTVSLTLHGVGLLGVAFAASIPLLAMAIMAFALGAGLTTLVRPHLVHEMTDGLGGRGYVNGRIARRQQLGRAAGPLVVASLATAIGYAAAIAAVATVFLICALAWQALAMRMRPS